MGKTKQPFGITARQKLKEWFWRYLPREIVGTVTALTAAIVTRALTGNDVAAAFAGTWGENLGFYGYGAYKEVRGYIEKSPGPKNFKVYSIIAFKSVRNLVLEFGPSEFFDSFILRPLFMFIGPKIVGNFSLGTLVGKLMADVFFYGIAAVAYEARKKAFKD